MYHGRDDFSSYGVKGILSAHSENIVNKFNLSKIAYIMI